MWVFAVHISTDYSFDEISEFKLWSEMWICLPSSAFQEVLWSAVWNISSRLHPWSLLKKYCLKHDAITTEHSTAQYSDFTSLDVSQSHFSLYLFHYIYLLFIYLFDSSCLLTTGDAMCQLLSNNIHSWTNNISALFLYFLVNICVWILNCTYFRSDSNFVTV